ncbi:MAG: aminoacyl-tRNA hydrolase [Rhodospirillales bacterium]|nr:aminoacyl-tRNA hydrolase [Rhodospirillales bacterium]
MWMFVGLGNPGVSYGNNRHNIGFMAVDTIAARWSFPGFRQKFKGLFSEGALGGERVLLLKPQTFMNLSGESVASAARFYKIDPSRIFVFHDELDLQPGKVRVKTGGGNAGHNGLKSIDAHLGTPDYGRIRLGIGHPGDRDRVHGYVLSDFSKADEVWLRALLDALADHAPLLTQGKSNDFMTRVAESRTP